MKKFYLIVFIIGLLVFLEKNKLLIKMDIINSLLPSKAESVETLTPIIKNLLKNVPMIQNKANNYLADLIMKYLGTSSMIEFTGQGVLIKKNWVRKAMKPKINDAITKAVNNTDMTDTEKAFIIPFATDRLTEAILYEMGKRGKWTDPFYFDYQAAFAKAGRPIKLQRTRMRNQILTIIQDGMKNVAVQDFVSRQIAKKVVDKGSDWINKNLLSYLNKFKDLSFTDLLDQLGNLVSSSPSSSSSSSVPSLTPDMLQNMTKDLNLMSVGGAVKKRYTSIQKQEAISRWAERNNITAYSLLRYEEKGADTKELNKLIKNNNIDIQYELTTPITKKSKSQKVMEEVKDKEYTHKNPWVQHVKRYAIANKMSYPCALSEAKKTYKKP